MKVLVAALRPQQWIKNLIVFAPLVFSLNAGHPDMLLEATAAFVVFCLAGSGVYVLNDIVDREQDRRHPVKCRRPVASGVLSVPAAGRLASVLLATALLLAVWDGPAVAVATAVYVANNLLYSLRLKHVVILDVGSIAFGFVIRVLAGTAAIGVPASPWLIMCTILLACFLGFAKRRHEIVLLEENHADHRAVLGDYSEQLLDQLIMISAACTVMSYALYTVSEKAVTSFGTTELIWTVPFVLYGLFRYLFLIHRRKSGGNPARVLLTDPPLMIDIVLWLAACCAIIYRH